MVLVSPAVADEPHTKGRVEVRLESTVEASETSIQLVGKGEAVWTLRLEPDGRWVATPPPGSYDLVAFVDGLLVHRQALTLSPGETVLRVIQVDADPELSDGVMVVEGQSDRTKLARQPLAVTSVDTTEAKRASADLGEVLAQSPGLSVRRNGALGAGSTIALHGLQGEQVRLFIDGVPLDAAGYIGDLSTVPVNVVDRIDVYKGVLPVRLGTDALGGALNLVTRPATPGVHGSTSVQAGSFGTYRGSATVSVRPADTGWFVRAQAFGDYAENDYRVAVEVPNDLGRLEDAVVPRFHDRYRGVGGRAVAGRYGKGVLDLAELSLFGSAFDKEVQHDPVMIVPYGEVLRTASTVGSSLRMLGGGDRANVELVASHARNRFGLEDVSDCFYSWFGTCNNERTVPGEIGDATETRLIDRETFGRLVTTWSPASAHTFEFSATGRIFGRQGDDLLIDEAAGEFDPLTAERDLWSLVTGLSYTLRPRGDRAEILAFGKSYHQTLRSEQVSFGDAFVRTDRSTNDVGGGLGVRVEPLRGWRFKTSYEYAIRQPTPEQLFGDGLLVVENLGLRPERSHNVNVGVTATTPSHRTWAGEAEVTGFVRQTEDLISTFSSPLFTVNENLFEARSVGVEGIVKGGLTSGRLVLDANGTWLDLRNTSEGGEFGAFAGDRIPNRPWLFATGSARSRWPLPAQNLSLTAYWTTRFTGRFTRNWQSVANPSFASGLPTQLAHSAGLGLLWGREGNEASLTVDLQNLSNALLFDVFGVQRPGRALSAKLTFTW